MYYYKIKDKKLIDSGKWANLNSFYKFHKKVDNYGGLISYYKQLKPSLAEDIEHKIILSLLDKNDFVRKISISDFLFYLRLLNDDKMNCNNILNDLKKMTEDRAQLNTLKRISHKNNLMECTNNGKKIIKNCPHCNNSGVYDENKDYVICGYDEKGFDWQGCGCDWCFECGKRLCKNWDTHQLFNVYNRFHNGKCCKNHAFQKGLNYLEEYCFCNKNKFVKR